MMKFFDLQLLILFELLISKIWAHEQRTMFYTEEIAKQSIKKLSWLIHLNYQRFWMIVDEQLHSEKNDVIWTKWEKVLTSIFNEMFWRVVIESSHQNDCRKVIFTVQLQKQTALSQLLILNFNQENMIVFDEEKQLNQEKEKDEKKKIAKFNDEDLKYSNDSVVDDSDDAKLQR